MDDIFRGDLITLPQAAALLPHRRNGRPTHPATLLRWADDGLRGVRLHVVQVGGVKCTTRDALQRFFEQLAAAPRPKRRAEGARA